MGRAGLIRLGWIVAGIAVTALAAAFIWTISAYQAQSTLDARYRAQDRAERASESIERNCGSAEPGAVVECVAKEIEAAREDQRAEYDLSAQNRMAEWAFWMMVVTAITAGLTAVALWFIRGTLDATREAVEEARNGTSAARRAVTETTRIGEAQVRSYLSVVGVNFSTTADDVSMVRRPKIEVVLNNSGATPAVNVEYFCGCECLSISQSREFRCPEFVSHTERLPTVPANGTDHRRVTSFGFIPCIRTYRKLRDAFTMDTEIGDLPVIVLWVSVFYDDVFGKTYRSDGSFILEHEEGLRDAPLKLTDAPQRTFLPLKSRTKFIKERGDA